LGLAVGSWGVICAKFVLAIKVLSLEQKDGKLGSELHTVVQNDEHKEAKQIKEEELHIK
jgi:hypothetical protein